MLTKTIKPLIISSSVTLFEFLIFVAWGKNMNPGDEMGFFLITTYLLFPLSTLILSAYLGRHSPITLVPFVIIMFAAQNFMPFLLTGTFEVGMIFLFTLFPTLIGAGIGFALKSFSNRGNKEKNSN